MSTMIEKVAWAIVEEQDRWECITGGNGIPDIIARTDDDGERCKIDSFPPGDAAMYFYDLMNAAAARAAIEAMREPTDAMVMASVDADHTLEAIEDRPDYPESCANIYRAMIDAALNEQVSG